MKRSVIVLLAVVLLTAFVSRNSSPQKVFDQLHVLEGKWTMKMKTGIIGEEWTKVNDHYLQSKGFFISKASDTMITEKVALEEKPGGIYYTSTVADQNEGQPVPFKLTSSDNNTFVFENPEHDYPKRITYHIVNKDSIHAWIDAGLGQRMRKSDFFYSRVK